MDLSAIRLKPVALGLITDVVVSLGVGFVIGLTAGMAGGPNVDLSPEHLEALTQGMGFKITALLGVIAAPGMGGYVAARVAYTNGFENALVIGVVDVILTLVTEVVAPGTNPQWLIVVGCVLAIPAALLGGKFAGE